MEASLICPKCGAAMNERPLTAADGTPLGFSGEGERGSLISLVCPSCGYAELRAAPSAAEPLGIEPDVTIKTPELAALARRFEAAAEPREAGVGSLIVLAVSAAFMVAGIIWIYLASGPVMEAGGFVAAGGPYAIAHPAEDWIWLPTMGATLMTFAFFGNFLMASHLNRPAGLSMLFFWTLLFGTNSYQFFKYGIHAPGGGQSWTWIVLGIVFAVLALPSLLLLLLPMTWRGFSGSYAWANALGVAGGVLGAIWVWSVVVG